MENLLLSRTARVEIEKSAPEEILVKRGPADIMHWVWQFGWNPRDPEQAAQYPALAQVITEKFTGEQRLYGGLLWMFVPAQDADAMLMTTIFRPPIEAYAFSTSWSSMLEDTANFFTKDYIGLMPTTQVPVHTTPTGRGKYNRRTHEDAIKFGYNLALEHMQAKLKDWTDKQNPGLEYAIEEWKRND